MESEVKDGVVERDNLLEIENQGKCKCTLIVIKCILY